MCIDHEESIGIPNSFKIGFFLKLGNPKLA